MTFDARPLLPSGAGHFVIVTHADRITAIVTKWLESLS